MTLADRIKFTAQMQQMKELIRGIVIKNQQEAHQRAAKYYLMHTTRFPVSSWVLVYNL